MQRRDPAWFGGWCSKATAEPTSTCWHTATRWSALKKVSSPGGSGRDRRASCSPTRLYGEALAALREPQFLRDGITRGIALETLNRPFSSCHQRPRVWPLTTEERRALTALDIPRFSLRADERCVREARDAGDLFRSSGLAAVDARLAAMSEDALVAHETAIAAALSVSVSTPVIGRTPLAATRARCPTIRRTGTAPLCGSPRRCCACPRIRKRSPLAHRCGTP